MNEGPQHVDVAIVVIAYNEARRIAACVSALLAQRTEHPFEVVVVDDGSTDDTAGVITSLAADDDRLRLVRHPVNLGRGAARRTGQDAVSARYVGFVDADIIVPPDWLDRCVTSLGTHDAVSGVAVPDGDCAVIWRVVRATPRPRPAPTVIGGGNVIFRSRALAVVPFGTTSRLGEDFRLAYKMRRSGLRLHCIEDLHVHHEESKSYLKGVAWTWELGVDAATHPYEIGAFRTPDAAWALWLVAALVAVVVAFFEPFTALLVIATVTLGIDAAFFFSRFKPVPHLVRFLAGLVAYVPMMVAYLLGRCWGTVRLVSASRRADLRDARATRP